jgi:hypothetical protein
MSGGETSVSGTDDNSLTLAYTAGYESVFINGVLQVRGSDYTATTGTSITGLTALTAGDIVMVESVMAYSVGDTYTQSQMTSLLGGKSDVSSTGLVLLVNQSVGSTPVSSVVVNNAFSSTYDSYKIIISGGTCSANSALRLQMRAGSTTESSALYAGASSATIYANGAYGSDWLGTTSSNWTYVGYANNTAGILSFNCELINPFIADQTLFNSQYSTYNSSRASAGYLNTTTSYDGFVISPETGTITGGTIKVYGYK